MKHVDIQDEVAKLLVEIRNKSVDRHTAKEINYALRTSVQNSQDVTNRASLRAKYGDRVQFGDEGK